MSDRLSTGADVLDYRLRGGIPAGKIVAVVAPPDTQSELLLETLAAERETLYLSTVRPAAEVLAAADLPESQLTVERVDADALFDDPDAYLDRIGPRSNVVVDPVNGLELADRSRYLAFLNALKSRLVERESVGMVHCLEQADEPPLRNVTLYRADLVWRLHLVLSTLSVDTRLVISKFRGGSALTEPIKLRLTDTVEIDTSRDIA